MLAYYGVGWGRLSWPSSLKEIYDIEEKSRILAAGTDDRDGHWPHHGRHHLHRAGSSVQREPRGPSLRSHAVGDPQLPKSIQPPEQALHPDVHRAADHHGAVLGSGRAGFSGSGNGGELHAAPGYFVRSAG